jgi:hypothetical protein
LPAVPRIARAAPTPSTARHDARWRSAARMFVRLRRSCAPPRPRRSRW